MKIAVATRPRSPMSIRLYVAAIERHLADEGVRFLPFTSTQAPPAEADLLWEPGLAGAKPPSASMRNAPIPIAATVHGAAPFHLGLRDRWPGLAPAMLQGLRMRKTRAAWRWFAPRVAAVIAVSNYGKREVVSVFGLDPSRVTAIHHGVDTDIFHQAGEKHTGGGPYFLHVSQHQPKKNLKRMLAAYQSLPSCGRPDFRIVAPGYRGPTIVAPGVHIRTQRAEPEELARLYRGATAFVFCSLHETFGLPILEAMACGCPVLTSTTTACGEIGADAAVLVDPHSVPAIASGMRRMYTDVELHAACVDAGLRRAAAFTWYDSAQKHLKLFQRVLTSREKA